MVRISVIVPTYNEEKFIGKCLDAIRSQKFRDCELIVVDGHSKDDTVKISRKYADKILFDKRCGVGAARNLGTRHASGDILAFTDADTIVCKSWLKTIDANFKRGKLIGLSGPLFSLDGNGKDIAMVRLYSQLIKATSGLVPLFAGNNCAYLRNAFTKAGGFREDLSICDDFEISMRMKKFGRMKFDRELCVSTSIRRVRQHGYADYIFKYMAASINLLLGRGVGPDYFRNIEK